MGLGLKVCLVFITGLLSTGSLSIEQNESRRRSIASSSSSPSSSSTTIMMPNVQPGNQDGNSSTSRIRMLLSENLDAMPQMDYFDPATVPIKTPIYNPIPTFNPNTQIMTPPLTPPTILTPANPYTAPHTGTAPSSLGQSWCVASPTASQIGLQVALDYACGYGSADCSAIQPGASCHDPDTVRDHASYAFNSYYQKNPIPTSCDFGGTAIITNVDPSTSSCQYSSTSTSPATLNPTNPMGTPTNPMGTPTNPTGPTIYGSIPPDSTDEATALRVIPLFLTLMCLLISIR